MTISHVQSSSGTKKMMKSFCSNGKDKGLSYMMTTLKMIVMIVNQKLNLNTMFVLNKKVMIVMMTKMKIIIIILLTTIIIIIILLTTIIIIIILLTTIIIIIILLTTIIIIITTSSKAIMMMTMMKTWRSFCYTSANS
jgi:hypothetical protein